MEQRTFLIWQDNFKDRLKDPHFYKYHNPQVKVLIENKFSGQEPRMKELKQKNTKLRTMNLVFPRDRPHNWLSNAKLAALKSCTYKNQQVVFRHV